MGYDILAAIFCVVMAPLVVAGFVLFWTMNARDHEELAGCWRAHAARRGLEFVEPSGEWPNRTSPIIEWQTGDATLRISAVGREARVHTRLVIRPQSTLLGSLAVSVDEAGAGVVAMREHPSGFARRIFSERVKRQLLGFRQRERVSLLYRRGRVVIEWPGGERNEARLDEAMRIGAELARSIDDEFRGGQHGERAKVA